MKNNRIEFLDELKGIAILGMILIHVNAQLISDITNNIFYSKHAYGILITCSYLTRYCVPIFILVTGYLLWNTHINTNIFKLLINKILPITAVYILWSLIYVLPSLSTITRENILELFLLGKSAPHMYYIPTIYIPVVIMIILVKKARNSFKFIIVNLIFWTMFQISGILNGTAFENLGFIFIYALIGASLNYLKINDKNKKIIKIFIILATIFSLCNFIYITKLKDFYVLQEHYSYFQISMAIYSVLIFILFLIKKNSIKALSFLGKYSMIVYFQHWMIYIYIYSIIQKRLVNSNFIFYILVCLITIFCAIVPILIDVLCNKKYSKLIKNK